MKPQHIVLLVVSLAVVGCDGYAYSFRPLPARVASTTSDERTLLQAVRQVARERGYKEKPAPEPEYAGHAIIAHFGKRLSDTESVAIELVRDVKDGVYRFIIVDWPSFTRSDESRAVEAAIKARLEAHQASNKSLQPTADRRENLHMTPSTLKFVAKLAPASGG